MEKIIIAKTTQKRTDLTLLQAMETIAENNRDSKLREQDRKCYEYDLVTAVKGIALNEF